MKLLKDLKPEDQLKIALQTLRRCVGTNKYTTIAELKDAWNETYPHFDGHGPHRYEPDTDFVECCVYCLRPKNWRTK